MEKVIATLVAMWKVHKFRNIKFDRGTSQLMDNQTYDKCEISVRPRLLCIKRKSLTGQRCIETVSACIEFGARHMQRQMDKQTDETTVAIEALKTCLSII